MSKPFSGRCKLITLLPASSFSVILTHIAENGQMNQYDIRLRKYECYISGITI